MRLQKILTVPDPLLRRPSRPVHRFGRTLDKLIEEMFRVVEAYDGLGLSAVQIGIPSEVIVVNHPDWRGAMINPYPKKWHGSQFGDEACLSIPGYIGTHIHRAFLVSVHYHDERGEKRELVAMGPLARVLQHEMDHLNGILITDYAQKAA